MGIVSSKIEFDYNTALQQADKLNEIAEGLKHSSKTIGETMTALNSGWQGESASAYIIKGQSLKEKVSDTSKDLSNAADKIREIAKKIHDAEMLALEIATKRSY